MLLLTRCLLWSRVYWNGWSGFNDGKCFAGKSPLQRAWTVLQSFIALQHHQALSIRNYNPHGCFPFVGSSVNTWHDQRASSRSLPLRHAIPHIKFNCKYLTLLKHSTAKLHPFITQRKVANEKNPESVWLKSCWICREDLWEWSLV